MGGARKALTSWVMLGMKFKGISFKSSEKRHPLGSFFVMKDVCPGPLPLEREKGRLVGAFLLSLLGTSRLSTDTLPSDARFRTRARMVGSRLPSRNQPCQ